MTPVAKRAIRGAAWTIATSVGSRALGLVGTLAIVRYLRPDEFGEVSAASVVTLSANQISTLGTGMYVIAYPKAGRDKIFHATAWHIASGALALLAVVLLRGPLGPMFDTPLMGRFVPGLALSVLLDRIGYVPERVLVRDLRFGQVSLARTAGELGYTTVSVGTAMLGWGAMSIVYGNLARSILRLVLTVAPVDRRDWCEPHPIRKQTLLELLGYGTTVSIAGVAAFAQRRWDNLLVSRLFGPAVMGAYSLAYNLADIPAVQVGEQITDVLLASFAHVEAENRERSLLRATALLGLIMFPLAVGLGATAPSIVRTFFDRKWADVAPMLMLLSVLSVPRPVAGALTAYLHAMKRPRTVMWLEWFSVALLLGGIATVGRAGPRWACGAVGAAFCLRALATMWVIQRRDGTRVHAFLVKLLPPLGACLPMVAAILIVRHGLGHVGVPSGVSLIAETAVGGIVYVAAALVIARQASRELIELARRGFARGQGAAHVQSADAAAG